ncbi:glycoside hydrolase family 104 protein [Leisingera caerulea]|uniref:glycoside hydrolase family 104 protein n=1 Tax=Leisingera caerulea TaxID=506591 RepID=UPI00137784EB|nr:glycoside hydrolase family 104 protein [Leisingera caerulea]
MQLEATSNGGLDVAEASVERFTAALRYLQENFAEVDEIVQRVAQGLVVVLVGRGIKLAIARGIAMRAAYVELAGAVSGVGTSATRALGPLARLGVAARAITGLMGGPLSLAVTAASIAALGLDIDTAADALKGADSASSDAAEALRQYAEASRQAAEDQDALSGKVTATTAEMVRQGRVAVQTALEASQKAQLELLGVAQGEGLFNGDHITGAIDEIFEAAMENWVRSGALGDSPDLDVITGGFVNVGPVFGDVLEALGDLRDGSRPISEIAETLNAVAGAGQEVTSIIGLFDDALEGVVDVDLDSVRDRMRAIAGDIGLFGEELAAIGEAQTEDEIRRAYDQLRTAMLSAAAAGKRLRETGEDGLLGLVEALAKGEIEIENLKSALEGTWSVAQEQPGQTFAGQIGDDAKTAADELERMERAHEALSRRQGKGLPGTDRGSYQRSELEAAQKGILDLVAFVEGTDKGRGYNETLGYGAFTDGPVNLINMTLKEILELQKQMLQHPDNTFNSSAAGRYQIVSTTLKDLIKDLGLSGDELFDKSMQDRLGMELVRRRMPQGREGFYNEWEGFKFAGTPWSTIQAGLGSQSISRLDPGVQKANEAAAEQRVRIQEDQARALKDLIAAGDEQLAQLELEAMLVGKSASEQARLTYIHEALTQAKAAGIDVEKQRADTGELLIDVINRQADAIAARTKKERESSGLSDQQKRDLEESTSVVKSAFDELREGGKGWAGFLDTIIDHMIEKLWEAALDPVWEKLGGLLNDVLNGGSGGGGGLIGALSGLGGGASQAGASEGGAFLDLFGGLLGQASGGQLVGAYAAGGDLQAGGRAAGRMQGRGHKRQDNILFWGAAGEFIQPGDAVDYYGVEFMEAIRQKRVPRYAAGGILEGSGAYSGAYSGFVSSAAARVDPPVSGASSAAEEAGVSVIQLELSPELKAEILQQAAGHSLEISRAGIGQNNKNFSAHVAKLQKRGGSS